MEKIERRLKKVLRSLPRKRKVKLKITATATNVAGHESSDVQAVKLKGLKRR